MAVLARTASAAVSALSLIGLLSYIILHNNKSRSRKAALRKRPSGVVSAIGNTPLIRIDSLSDATGCEVIFLSFYFPLSTFLTAISSSFCCADFGES